jgi:hypothetical protein
MMTATLTTDHGKFVCAEEGGGVEGAVIDGRPAGLATGTRTHAGAWETFEVERDGDVCYLKSSGDSLADPPLPPMYGCAENEGKEGYFVFNRPHGGAWEALIPHELHDGRVAFEIQCRPKHFLCAEPDGRIVIRQPMWEGQPTDVPGGYESFTPSVDLFPPSWGSDLVPLAGPVRVVNELFLDDTGLILPLGCHFGEAFSAWCRGRQAEVVHQLQVVRQAGYDHIRVWLNLGYYPVWRGREVAFTRFQAKDGHWVEATPGYSDHRLSFNAMLSDVGLRGLFSRGDCNSISDAAIEAHLHEERRILSHDPEVIFGVETANEKWQNFPRSLAENEPACKALMERVFGGTGWLTQNSCPPGSAEDPASFEHMVQNWFTCANVHGSREFEDMEKVLRRHFNYGYERYTHSYAGKKYAMESTEPGGPGQGVSVGNTSDLWKIMAMHAATLVGRSATVYMSGHGVFWNGPLESQPGFWEVPRLRTIFGPDAFSGQAVHGNRAEAWVTSAGGMNNTNPNGYARMDQLLTGNHGVCIAHHGGSGRKPVFRVNAQVSIRNWDLTERMAFTSTPGYVRDIGGDGLIVMDRGGPRQWSVLAARRA